VRQEEELEMKPAVIREKFALRFWKMKVRLSCFAWFSKEFKFTQAAQSVVSWDGTKYIWGGKQKGQYRHYWRKMWGHRDTERGKYLVSVADFIERAANSSWWYWEDGSRPFFWRWSAGYHNQIRVGIPLWYRGTAPRNIQSQKKDKDP
jgi:hypothetical protein